MENAECGHGCDCLREFQTYLVQVATNPEVQEFINKKWIETKKEFPSTVEVVEEDDYEPAIAVHATGETEEEGDSESEQSEISYPSSGSSTTCFGDNCGCQGGPEECVPIKGDGGATLQEAGVARGAYHVQHLGEYKGVDGAACEVSGEALQVI